MPTAGVDAIHLFSHDSSASLNLGPITLDNSNLTTYRDTLAQIDSGLMNKEGALLLYGCNVTGAENDRAFIDELAQITGADVAESDDISGNAALGGDWVLEAVAKRPMRLYLPDSAANWGTTSPSISMFRTIMSIWAIF